MNASTISRAIAVLGKYLPPEEMESLIKDLLKLKTTQVDWNFPLSETLEAFNEKLIDLIGAQGTLNYSETALVIQNSTNVFERRVEALHSDTCRMREVLNEHEQENEAAKASKPRHKSHQNKLDLEKIERVDFLKEVTKNCFLKSKKSLKKPKLLSQRYPQLENMCRHKFSLDVMDTQGEKIGKKYDFRCNQQLTSSHMLVDELSPEDFQKSPPKSSSPDLILDRNLLPSCSTPYPTSSPGPSNLHHHHPLDDEPPIPPDLTPRRSSSSPTPSQTTLDPHDTSDFDGDDYYDSNPLNQTLESGYCTFTDCSTSGSPKRRQSLSKNPEIHEDCPPKVLSPSSSPSLDPLGLETPPENPSPLPPTPSDPSETQIPLQEPENPRKRNRESVETDAGYTSGSPEDPPASPEDPPGSPEPARRSKRLKKSIINDLNEKSYKAIPFEAPIPEKSKNRTCFKLPCPLSLLISKRPRKRKIEVTDRRDQKLRRYLMKQAAEKNKFFMCSPLKGPCTEQNEEIYRIFGENFNVSKFDAVLGVDEDLKGFSPVSKTRKTLEKARVKEFDAVLAENSEDLRGFALKGSTRVSNDGKCSKTDEKEKSLTDVVDDRLQELQETSCSYTPPHSPDFPEDFEVAGGWEEEEGVEETSTSRMTHQQRIEERMKQLQREFDVENDREEETAKWFDLMETLRVAEKRPVFDVKEYEERIVRNLEAEDGERLGFEEMAGRGAPEDIARLFVASLQLANTYTVDITASDDQSNVYLSLLKPDASQSS